MIDTNTYKNKTHNSTYIDRLDENKSSSISQSNSSPKITIDNHTYILNKTDSSTDCKPECYLNCQVHFPEPTEQKYCLINVCHCKIIEMSQIYLLSINNDSDDKIKNENKKNHMNIIQKEKMERKSYAILMILLYLLLIPFLIYFCCQMYKYSDIADRQYFSLQSMNNDHYSLMEG